MSIALVNSMFSQDAGPPILPIDLAYRCAELEGLNPTVIDLNLEIYLRLGDDTTPYHLLACLFGGYNFSYPLTAFVPFNEFSFEALPTLELLLALMYAPDQVGPVLRQVCAHYGLPFEHSATLLSCFVQLSGEVAASLVDHQTVILDMPSPASVLPGLLTAHFIRRIRPEIPIIGIGNQVNVPEVAAFALASGALTQVLGGCQLADLFKRLREARGLPPVRDADNILPALDLLPSAKYPLYHGLRIVPFATSQGCPFPCNFCSERMTWSHDGSVEDTFVVKAIDGCLRQIDHLRRTLGLAGITFLDCIMNPGGRRTIELLSALRGTDLLLSGGFRVDTLNEAIIGLMQEARFTNIIVGLETVWPPSVDRYRKGGLDYVTKAEKMVPLLFEYGIFPQQNILICHPREELSEVQEAVMALAAYADRLQNQGIPFINAPVGTVVINYPSRMYFEVRSDKDFRVIFHRISEPLRTQVPEAVLRAAESIPEKALRRSTEACQRINKLDFCRQIYRLWSQDQRKIARYTVSAFIRHRNLVEQAWRTGGVVAKAGSQLKSIHSNTLRGIPSLLAKICQNAEGIPVAEISQRIEGMEPDDLVENLLTLSTTGLVDLVTSADKSGG